MPNTSLLFLIYNDLVSAVSGIGERTFLDRPKTLSDSLTNFVVVDIPTEVRSRIKGSIDVAADCYGVFSVFAKSKTDGTINIGAQTTLTQSVLDLFPINGEHIVAKTPTVLMQGEDGYGYHVTEITFKIRTKLNSRTS